MSSVLQSSRVLTGPVPFLHKVLPLVCCSAPLHGVARTLVPAVGHGHPESPSCPPLPPPPFCPSASVRGELLPLCFLRPISCGDLGRVGRQAAVVPRGCGGRQRQEGDRLQANEIGEGDGIGGTQQGGRGCSYCCQRWGWCRAEGLRESHAEVNRAGDRGRLGGRFGCL